MIKQEFIKLFFPLNEAGEIDYNLWIIPKLKAVKGLFAPYLPFIIFGIIVVVLGYRIVKGLFKFSPWLYTKVSQKEKTISYEPEIIDAEEVDSKYGFSYSKYQKD